MRILTSILAFLFLSASLHAQLDRSKRPTSSEAPQIEFGDYKLYELKNGLNVIVVEDHKLPRIAINLVVDRGPVFEGENAGYVSLAGEMLRQGTKSVPKDSLDETVDFIGASLNTSATNVFTSGLSKYNERLMSILADVTLNPAFPESEFEKLKKQQISGLETAKDNPDDLSNRLFNTVMYGKQHPYGETVTIESTKNVQLEDCKQYYQKYWKPNTSYITFVGDIKPRKAKKLAKKYLGDWESGEIQKPSFEDPAKPEQTQVSIIDRSSSVQTVLEIGNTIELEPGDEDIAGLNLANQILGGGSLGRLFQNIREDKGYTYGAYSNYDDDRLVGEFSAGASVRTEVTDSAVTEFLYEFDRLRNEEVPQEDLRAAKNYIIGSFGRGLERPQTVARFALNIERYDLPKDYYEQYIKKLNNLSAEAVKSAANKYIQADALHITAVGKGTAIGPKLEKFGPVNWYDYKGNPTSAPSMDLPEGLTAEKVIDDYIKAIGGAEAIESIDNTVMNMKMEVPGAPQALDVEILHMKPNYFLFDAKMEGMGSVQKQVYDGKSGKVTSMQGNQTMEGDDLKDMAIESYLVPETHYAEKNVETELVEMANVNGEAAYAVEVTYPTGTKKTDYYSAETGLKIQKVTTQETQQGTMTQTVTYGEYEEHGGVKFPTKQTQKAGGQNIKMSVTNISINEEGIDKSSFQ